MRDDEPRDARVTLEADEIESAERRFGRRSSLRMVGAAVAGALGLVTAPKSARAQSDSDTGRYADPPGRGRTGFTDRDAGPSADQPGHGRQRGRTGITDTDGGPNADAPGNGHGDHCSDSDGGQYADPAGRGRRC